MRKFLVLIIFGVCLGLFSQPKPFDPDYYRDTLRVKKSDEFKKLEKYREKYKKLGLPLATRWSKNRNPSYLADLFYHRGINLDSIDAYRRLGFFKSNDPEEAFNDVVDNYFKPVIVIGKVVDSNWEGGYARYYPFTIFEVKKIITGREYFKDLPAQIKCYFSTIYGPSSRSIGKEYILYIDVYTKDYISLNHIEEKDEYGNKGVFFNVEFDALLYEMRDNNDPAKSWAEVLLNDLNYKITVINALRLENRGDFKK